MTKAWLKDAFSRAEMPTADRERPDPYAQTTNPRTWLPTLTLRSRFSTESITAAHTLWDTRCCSCIMANTYRSWLAYKHMLGSIELAWTDRVATLTMLTEHPIPRTKLAKFLNYVRKDRDSSCYARNTVRWRQYCVEMWRGLRSPHKRELAIHYAMSTYLRRMHSPESDLPEGRVGRFAVKSWSKSLQVLI